LWQAQIVRTEGVVDEKSRVTYAVARIVDPYKLESSDHSESALPMGTFVAADIVGTTVPNIVRIPRSALRANNQLMFIDSDDKLQVRRVDVLRADNQFAYLGGGAVAGDRISLTTIESPLNGMQVRTEVDSGYAAEQRIAESDRN
jgi:multidrug efflux pump subunit AcrA (membrane-fusion protein)